MSQPYYITCNAPPDALHYCGGDCGSYFFHSQLDPIKDLFERIEAGGTVPSGECPRCGALTYLVKENT